MWHAVYTTPLAEDAIFTQTTMNIYFRTQTTQNYAEFSYIANARMCHPEVKHKRSTCKVCESLRSLRERKNISEGSLCGKKHLVGVLEIVHYTMNTLHNISDIEIDEQPQSFIHKPEISMQLFVVYGLEFLYGFEFHDDLIVYKEI